MPQDNEPRIENSETTNRETENREAVPLPVDDTERLDNLLGYLDDLQGALLHVSVALNAKPAQQEKKRASFVKRFGVAPEVALQNALTGLTRQTLAVKAQRALAEMESEELGGPESDM